jgi:hypothetical protein
MFHPLSLIDEPDGTCNQAFGMQIPESMGDTAHHFQLDSTGLRQWNRFPRKPLGEFTAPGD